MRAFLNQPVEPQTGVIECMIRRKKGVMNTVYQAYYEVSKTSRMHTRHAHVAGGRRLSCACTRTAVLHALRGEGNDLTG